MIRIGILGCGRIARMYLEILARVPEVELTALAADETVRRGRPRSSPHGGMLRADRIAVPAAP